MASRCISAPRGTWLRAAWQVALGAVVCTLVGCASTSPSVPGKAAAPRPDAEPRPQATAAPARAATARAATAPAAKTELAESRDTRADAHGNAAPRAAPAAEAEAVIAPAPLAAREPALADGPAAPADETRGDTARCAADEEVGLEVGLASWYGAAFQGRRTAIGERFDMHRMTAAHKTMPLPSFALVRNRATGKEVVVRVNDRGPFIVGRIIDLSRAAARELGIFGVGRVEVRQLAADDSRVRDWHARALAPLAKPRRLAVR